MAHPSPMSSPSDLAPARRRPMVRRLMLRDFRSYAALDLALEGALIAFCGENGAGKTNLLEALSLFAPGRGLSRAELAACARVGGAGGFAISIEVEDEGASRQLGAGLEAPPPTARPSGSIASIGRRSPRRAPSPTSCAWSG